MDFCHLDFVEAVEDLATFVGVAVPKESYETKESAQKKDNINDYYQLLEKIADFYENCLRSNESGKKVVDYLKSRGVSTEIAKEFKLGYAPDEWQAVTNRFDQPSLIQTGMSIAKEGKLYDRFRNRVMYPIRDKRGRIVGFGGRVLDDSLPKYLNSPETPIFHKGKEVYGLYELLKRDGKPKRILIVEGYMDVIALACSGIHYAVATLGTATSQTHLDLLFRFSSELVFCFDGDNAGRNAAWRAMDSAFGAVKDGRQIRIMLLPSQHDPDSLVRAEGAEKFTHLVQQSKPLSDYFFSTLTTTINLNELEGRSQLAIKAQPYLEKLPEGVYREMMFAKLKELTHTNFQNDSKKSSRLPRRPIVAGQNQGNRVLPLPRRVLALLIQHPQLIDKIKSSNIIWDSLEFSGRQLFQEIFEAILEKRPANTGTILELYRNHEHEKIVKTLASLDLFPPDQKIDAEWVTNEFRDGLEKLLMQARKESDFQKIVSKNKQQ